jgi:hypothetical protein
MRDSQVARAAGEQKARVMAAEAEAEARVRIAQAEAEAIRLIASSLGGTNPASYLIGVRYIDALKAMGDGNAEKVVYLPYEASALMASVGGIRDLFSQVSPAPPAAAPAEAVIPPAPLPPPAAPPAALSPPLAPPPSAG